MAYGALIFGYSVFLLTYCHGYSIPNERKTKERSASEYNKLYHVQMLVDNDDNCKTYSLDKNTLLEAVWYEDAVYFPCSFTIKTDEPFCVEILAQNIPCESNIPLLWLREHYGQTDKIEDVPCKPTVKTGECYPKGTIAIATFQSKNPRTDNSIFRARFYTSTMQIPVENAWVVFNDRSYFFGKQRRTWYAARDFCESENSMLVKVDSEEEADWLSQHQSKTNDFWIGGIRSYYGDFVWYKNLEDMAYTHWNANEPNSNNMDTCVLMSAAHDGNWVDTYCTIVEGFICEKHIS